MYNNAYFLWNHYMCLMHIFILDLNLIEFYINKGVFPFARDIWQNIHLGKVISVFTICLASEQSRI